MERKENQIRNNIRNAIREVQDFPKPGINFKDITPVLANPELCRAIISEMESLVKPMNVDAILGIESRGFIFGMPLANSLSLPFLVSRKKGKLPYKTHTFSYALEYGIAEMEMHVDSVKPGQKVLVHDDLLATGGTAMAAAELVKMQGGEVAGFLFMVELGSLNGREKLEKYSGKIISLVTY